MLRRWGVLSGWAVACAVIHARARGFGWHYFVTGARVLDSGHGLNLYATHDQLQSGPLSFVAVLPLVTLLPAKAAECAGIVLMIIAGLVLVSLIERLCVPRSPAASEAGLLAVELVVVAVWSEVAVHWAHPDDVLALLSLFAALYLFRDERSVVAGVLLALSVDWKPWALLFAPMLLLAGRRDRMRAVAAFVVVVLAAWLPFYLADSATLHAESFRISVSSASVLHLFGVRGGTPSWCRPAQILLGAGVVTLAIRRNRWHAIVLVGVCARMLLDPATKNYYESGLVAAAGLYDLVAAETLIPVLTLGAVLLVYLPSYLLTALPTERAVARLLFLVAAPCLVLGLHARFRSSAPATTRSQACDSGSVIPELGACGL